MKPLVLVAVLAGLLLAVPAAPAASSVTLTSCRGMTIDYVNLVVTRLKQSGTTCPRARAVARAWANSDSCNPDTAESAGCEVRGYDCTSRNGPGYRSTVSCRTPRGKRVGFQIGPR